MSTDLRHFCNEIRMTLWALEEGTPWANKTELYIGILKKLYTRTCGKLTPLLSYGTIVSRGGLALIT